MRSVHRACMVCWTLTTALWLAGVGCSGGSGPGSPDGADSDATHDADGLGGDPGLEPDADAAFDGDSGADEDGGLLDQDDPAPDAGDPAGDADCQGTEPFDYTCTAGQPDSCPGGICMLGLCIAPVLDEHRWDACGDGLCDACETAAGCPADCGAWPAFTGAKVYDSPDTMTVWVHGFYNKSPDEIANMTYGEFRGCGGLLAEMAHFGVQRPCGDSSPGDRAPNQFVEVEYYGAVPPAWMSAADIAEIEQFPYDGASALERYARIVAKSIRYKLQVSSAGYVNLGCHSMGCLILRHVIEHDLEGLATENRLVRWFSSAGVIAGARLARLYDNPSVQQWAPLLGLELNDFVIMHPDFVQDHTCIWDHQLHQGNNPTLQNMLIHHATATDPHVSDALGLALLDLNNPGDEPNDGIMYTQDEWFASQAPEVAFHAPDGRELQPTHNAVYVDHMGLPETDAAVLLAAAGLFHRRKVRISLSEVELFDDRENHAPFDGEHGTPPAEVVAEVRVRYDPYVLAQFGRDVLVHETTLEHRSCEMFVAQQGAVVQPDYLLFDGPVFDGMNELQLHVRLLEVDWYPRMDVFEWSFDTDQELITIDEAVPLVEAEIVRENPTARARIRIEVFDLY